MSSTVWFMQRGPEGCRGSPELKTLARAQVVGARSPAIALCLRAFTDHVHSPQRGKQVTSVPFFFLKVCLFERQSYTEGRKDEEKKRFPCLVRSPQGPAAASAMWRPVRGLAGLPVGPLSTAFPRAIAELDGKWSIHMRRQHCWQRKPKAAVA